MGQNVYSVMREKIKCYYVIREKVYEILGTIFILATFL